MAEKSEENDTSKRNVSMFFWILLCSKCFSQRKEKNEADRRDDGS